MSQQRPLRRKGGTARELDGATSEQLCARRAVNFKMSKAVKLTLRPEEPDFAAISRAAIDDIEKLSGPEYGATQFAAEPTSSLDDSIERFGGSHTRDVLKTVVRAISPLGKVFAAELPELGLIPVLDRTPARDYNVRKVSFRDVRADMQRLLQQHLETIWAANNLRTFDQLPTYRVDEWTETSTPINPGSLSKSGTEFYVELHCTLHHLAAYASPGYALTWLNFGSFTSPACGYLPPGSWIFGASSPGTPIVHDPSIVRIPTNFTPCTTRFQR